MSNTAPQIEVLMPGVQHGAGFGTFRTTSSRHCTGWCARCALAHAHNTLVRNGVDAAGIEIAIGPFAIRFQKATWFALLAQILVLRDGQPVAPGWRYHAEADQVLTLFG